MDISEKFKTINLDSFAYVDLIVLTKRIETKRLDLDKRVKELKEIEDKTKEYIKERMKKDDVLSVKTDQGLLCLKESKIVVSKGQEEFLQWLREGIVLDYVNWLLKDNKKHSLENIKAYGADKTWDKPTDRLFVLKTNCFTQEATKGLADEGNKLPEVFDWLIQEKLMLTKK